MVGTTEALAPWCSSRAMVEADCSLVRGTRTLQPKSALVSNQDSDSRRETVEPTTASTGNVASAITLAASARVVTEVRCWIVVPRSVTATGVDPSRPAACSASRVVAARSAGPRTTTVTPGSTAAPSCAFRSPAATTSTPVEEVEVSGTPA